MAKTLIELLAGEDMEGGESFCDSIYNFLKNQGKDINLFTNSGFGVWSQSDANKGLATITYDAGSAGGGSVPSVGDAVVGGTSGAVCKVISYTIASGSFAANNATGVVTVGAVSSDFAFVDNETITFDGAETAVINMTDGAVQVGLIQNGGFATDTDPPPGWTVVNGTISTEAGGRIGNCMKLLDDGTSNSYTWLVFTTVVGKIYKTSIWAKDIDTGRDGGIKVGTAITNGVYYTSGAITADAWTQHTITFEATTATTYITLYCSTAGGAYYYDEITAYEITPCCTGASLGPDGWDTRGSDDVYRQHNDGGTLTKEGGFYSLKFVPTGTAVDRFLAFPSGYGGKEEWARQIAGEPMTVGAWVLANTANHARLSFEDNDGQVFSSYHTGGGDWEWLELTREVGASITFLITYLWTSVAPNVDGTTIVYIEQPMLVFGWALGEGMYQPRLQEMIWLVKNIPSNTYDNTTDWSDVAAADLNIEADSDAMLPKGAKLIAVHCSINDSGSGGGLDVHLQLRKDATSDFFYCNSVAGKTNDVHGHKSGVQPCDVSGDVDIHLDATGANTLDIEQFEYHGVQVT